jgi:hypothetical protein
MSRNTVGQNYFFSSALEILSSALKLVDSRVMGSETELGEMWDENDY